MSFVGIVYIVDDDDASALSLQALLTAHGFEVQVFACAENFLVRIDSTSCGCAVLDLRLSGMSGLELQKELTSRKIHLPIVMISGHADSQSVAQAIENGASAFLQKPFSGADLCDAILNSAGGN